MNNGTQWKQFELLAVQLFLVKGEPPKRGKTNNSTQFCLSFLKGREPQQGAGDGRECTSPFRLQSTVCSRHGQYPELQFLK